MFGRFKKDMTGNVRRKKPSFQSSAGFKLFLMSLPFLAATFVFNYLPLFGWSYAFFDYRVGFRLLDTPFVGLQHFMAPFECRIARRDLVRVLQNTIGMSSIGLATSWLPMVFAIFLAELSSNKFRRSVQTITTIPHFISWVLVYAIAFAMFSIGDGFVNRILIQLGFIDQGINFLASRDRVWLSMWLYGTWKGLGWGAILYIAAMASIDAEQIEAATVDGAGRFRRIWHITIPGLLPTFFVLFVLAVSNFFNTGFEQFFLFENAMTRHRIEVLDLFIYNQGMVRGQLSYTTAVGMLRTFISLILLFSANRMSKLVRGETVF